MCVYKCIYIIKPFTDLHHAVSGFSCTDHPGYKDKYSTTCETTRELGNCRDGKRGNIDEETLMSNANNDGVSVLDACCVCGGGNKGTRLFEWFITV